LAKSAPPPSSTANPATPPPPPPSTANPDPPPSATQGKTPQQALLNEIRSRRTYNKTNNSTSKPQTGSMPASTVLSSSSQRIIPKSIEAKPIQVLTSNKDPESIENKIKKSMATRRRAQEGVPHTIAAQSGLVQGILAEEGNNSEQTGNNNWNGGSSKKYYLQDHRKSFESESPISAAEKAFQFIRENNKLKNKSIKFTLEDRIKNKKYNFSARTRSNGENVVKKIRN